MKSCSLFLMIFFLLLTLPLPAEALSVSAQYACVMDAATGRVLYDKNASQTHSMASTTKIMTALLALENTSAEEIVTVSKNAAGTEGSSLYLAPGEKIPMEDLLYGLMLNSGNDAAIAVAEHVGKTVTQFADMMTARAKEIGAVNTSFKNPNGLDEKGHYTTAYDLALITRAALQNPKFSEIVSTKTKTTKKDSGNMVRTFVNHNKLLSLYQGCIGVKTGYTKKTGRCLVSAATKNHTTFICVTLNAPDDWNDHTRLLNDAFSRFSASPLIVEGMVLKSLPVKNGSLKTIELQAKESFFFGYEKKEDLAALSLEYELPACIPAPVSKGVEIGRVMIKHEGKVLKEIPLLSALSVDYVAPPKPDFYDNLKKIFHIFLQFS